MERDELFLRKMEETADAAYQKGIVSFTDFLDLYEIHRMHSVNWREHGVSLCLSGGYEAAERQMAAFLPDALSYEWEFPFSCVKVFAAAPKFAGEMTHRDYLGAVLGLGIDRRVLGDILVGEKQAFIFCKNTMVSYLQKELTSVGKTAVHACICENPQEIPAPAEEEITGSVASLRLDAVIALAFRSSRSSMLPLIQEGRVFVNGRLAASNGTAVEAGDIISVRGHGKFRFDDLISKTKKGRCMVRLYRYR